MWQKNFNRLSYSPTFTEYSDYDYDVLNLQGKCYFKLWISLITVWNYCSFDSILKLKSINFFYSI